MSILTWENPDRRRGQHGSDWTAVATQLRDNPGQWAVIHRYEGERGTANAGNLAWRIREGHLVAFKPAGAFEARAHGNAVYARTTPEE